MKGYSRGASLVEYTLVIALIAVGIIATLAVLRKGAQDALCSPVGGLKSSEDPQGRITKYHWNDATQSCEPITAGF